MHPETKKTQKHAYLTLTEKHKTTKPWTLVKSPVHPARKRSMSILEHKTHTCLLTYLLTRPGPIRGALLYITRHYVVSSSDATSVSEIKDEL